MGVPCRGAASARRCDTPIRMRPRILRTWHSVAQSAAEKARFGPTSLVSWHVTCDSGQHSPPLPGSTRRMSMHSKRFGWLWAAWAALAGATALLTANVASAQDCKADADCGDGYACKTGLRGGQLPRQAVSGRRRARSATIPVDAGTMETVSIAKPSRAAKTATVGTRWCVTAEVHECSGGGAVARVLQGGRRVPRLNRSPVDTGRLHGLGKQCMERWAVPCKQDADCGPGFDCKEVIEMACSGGGVAPSAGGGARLGAGCRRRLSRPAASAARDVHIEPRGMFACELKDLPCDTDDDCPSGLECTDNYAGVACASPAQIDRRRRAAPRASGSAHRRRGRSARMRATRRSIRARRHADEACMPQNY